MATIQLPRLDNEEKMSACAKLHGVLRDGDERPQILTCPAFGGPEEIIASQ